jgi:hypothetical protein
MAMQAVLFAEPGAAVYWTFGQLWIAIAFIGRPICDPLVNPHHGTGWAQRRHRRSPFGRGITVHALTEELRAFILFYSRP